MFTKTVSSNGVEFTLKNTIANFLTWRSRMEKWEPDENAKDVDCRLMFAEVSSHLEKVSGIKWTPPPPEASEEELEKSYQALLPLISYDFLVECSQAVHEMHRPIGSYMEIVESQLPEEKKADPNS